MYGLADKGFVWSLAASHMAIGLIPPPHSDQTERPPLFSASLPLMFEASKDSVGCPCPCRRSTNARSRPRSNHLLGIGERTGTGIEWTFWAIASCDVEQAAAGLPFLRLSFRVSDLSERRHSIPIPRLPSAWCARVPRTTCDVMFRSLFCVLCLGQLATPSPCACGRRKQRTTSKPANTISSVFITFQVRPQGTTRKERRKEGRKEGRKEEGGGHFPRGILAKRGIFLANEPRTPSVTPKVRPQPTAATATTASGVLASS